MLDVNFVQLKPKITISIAVFDIGNWIFDFPDLPDQNHLFTLMWEALLGGLKCSLH